MSNTGISSSIRKWVRSSIQYTAAIAIGSLLLTGCSLTLPSANPQASDAETGMQEAGSQLPLIQEAFSKSAAIQRYGLKASISTTANNFTKTTTLYGHVVNPDLVNMNEVVDGKSYMIIQTADQTYVRTDNKWSRTDRIDKPFDLFGSMANLPALAKSVRQLKDDTVISTPTYVFQFDANAMDAATTLKGQLTPENEKMADVPVTYTVWIGKKDHLIYQIRMQWAHAITNLGNVSEDASYMFFDLNTNVPIGVPTSVLDQINKIPGEKTSK